MRRHAPGLVLHLGPDHRCTELLRTGHAAISGLEPGQVVAGPEPSVLVLRAQVGAVLRQRRPHPRRLARSSLSRPAPWSSSQTAPFVAVGATDVLARLARLAPGPRCRGA